MYTRENKRRRASKKKRKKKRNENANAETDRRSTVDIESISTVLFVCVGVQESILNDEGEGKSFLRGTESEEQEKEEQKNKEKRRGR